jgi:N-acetylmuramoyl-L-alanine amidase
MNASARARRRRVSARRFLLRRVMVLTVIGFLVVGVVNLVGDATGGGSTNPTKVTAARSPLDGGRALNTQLFSSSACMAFAPTRGSRGLTVFLDAGHGGIDPGGVGVTDNGTAITEAALNLPIELDTMALLRDQGFRVVVSRTGPTTVLRTTDVDVSNGAFTSIGAHDDVAARAKCANLAGAAVLLGIYLNTGASPTNAGSITAYDAARPFAAANARLAALVQSNALAAMNAHGWDIPNGGAIPDTNLGSRSASVTTALGAAAQAYHHLLLLGPAQAGYFDSPSEMPGALIEPLFITDPFEGTIAASATGQHAIADALSQAITQFLAPTPTTTSTTSG